MAKITGNTVGIPNPITDYAQNDPTKADYIKNRPLYLTNFFKEIPEGKTIDDLRGDDCPGCYILYEPEYLGNIGLLYVGFGVYVEEEMATTCTWQTRYIQDGKGIAKIEKRNDADGYWTPWEEVYDKSKFDTYFKEVPSGVSIDTLYGKEHLGCYIGKVNSYFDNGGYWNDEFNFLFVNDGWTVTDTGDEPNYFQTRFVWDGFNYRIQTRKGSGGTWSNWEDAFGGGSGGATFFESSTPQIDITLEEEVKNLAISELNGKALADYKFTTMKIVMENAQLAATGTGSEVVIRVNNNNLSGCSVHVPTTFINNSTKQYWGGYISLLENLYLGGQAASTQPTWRMSIQMPVDTSKAMDYKQIETIYIYSVSATMPIGTKIKIWLK